MPKQVPPTPQTFSKFERTILKIGFLPISRTEVADAIRRNNLKAPRKREGREAGFKYYANGFVVYVWTTWLPEEGRARDEDAGWVLIVEKGVIRYSSRPFHRTKNFLRNLLLHARLTQLRVSLRPKCPECGLFMDIVHGKARKSCYWSCRWIGLHADGRPHTLDWDTPLPPIAQKHAKARRRPRAKRRIRLKKEGKSSRPAMDTRKRWSRAQAVSSL